MSGLNEVVRTANAVNDGEYCFCSISFLHRVRAGRQSGDQSAWLSRSQCTERHGPEHNMESVVESW